MSAFRPFALATVLVLAACSAPVTPSTPVQTGGVTEAKVVDETTVDVVTQQLDVTIPANGGYLWIMPKKYFESVSFDGSRQKPIGSGPYLLTDFKDSDSMTFKKRPEAHPLRKAEAAELVFKIVPDNSQIVNCLITGDIDIAAQFAWTGAHKVN